MDVKTSTALGRPVTRQEKLLLGGIFCSVAIARRVWPWTATVLLIACVCHVLGIWHEQNRELSGRQWPQRTMRIIWFSAASAWQISILALTWSLIACITVTKDEELAKLGIGIFLVLESFAVLVVLCRFLPDPDKRGWPISGQDTFVARGLHADEWLSRDAPQRATLSRHIDHSGDELSGDALLAVMALYQTEVSGLAGTEGHVFAVHDKSQTLTCVAFATVVRDYDLLDASSALLPAGVRRTAGLVHKALGKYSPLRKTLVLLGFQWPFRHAVFFRREDNESTRFRILQCLLSCLKATLQAEIVLLPCHSDSELGRLLQQTSNQAHSCFSVFHLPPTYRATLPSSLPPPTTGSSSPLCAQDHATRVLSRGSSWQAYVSHLKLQYRRNVAKHERVFAASGYRLTVVESWTKDDSIGAARLIQNISDKRARAGETRMLIQPSAAFLYALNNDTRDTNKRDCVRQWVTISDRAGEVVASTFLFHFPRCGVVTSDLKGLVHEKTRAARCYFALLVHTIRTAVDSAYSSVDFGPTTGRPKLEVGCVAIPMLAGLWCHNPWLEWAMQRAGQAFTLSMSTFTTETTASEGKKAQECDASATVMSDVGAPAAAAAAAAAPAAAAAAPAAAAPAAAALPTSTNRREAQKAIRKRRGVDWKLRQAEHSLARDAELKTDTCVSSSCCP